MKKLITYFIVAFISLTSNAQTEKDYVTKGMLIMYSAKNYNEARKFAEQAAKKLDLNLDLRGLLAEKTAGLTLSEADCDASGWYYPCYVQRGRDDDKEYISIEYSNYYKGFTKGLYIVVAATGNNNVILPTLKKIKKVYKNAYVNQTEIFMGCMN